MPLPPKAAPGETIYYLDTIAVGGGILATTGRGFHARVARGLDEHTCKALMQMWEDWKIVQQWLRPEYNAIARTDYKIDTPENVKEILCRVLPKDEPPSKQDTEVDSSTESPSNSTKKVSRSSTKRTATKSASQ